MARYRDELGLWEGCQIDNPAQDLRRHFELIVHHLGQRQD